MSTMSFIFSFGYLYDVIFTCNYAASIYIEMLTMNFYHMVISLNTFISMYIYFLFNIHWR
jgi:hypothetical protein